MRRGMIARVLALSASTLVVLVGGGRLAGAADSAAVLPRGVASVTADARFFLPIDERYNQDGKVESAAADLNGPLDSTVFPLLAPLNPLVGNASIGDAVVTFDYSFTIVEFGAQYGLTDKLSVGVKIPYWWASNDVNARLDSGPGSSANVGFNPGAGPPIIPIAAGGRPLTTDQVQALIGPGLGPIPGFGFKRVEDWSDNGLGDIEAGAKYQYLNTQDWLLAAAGGVRFPTGKVDDADSLVDYGFGSGAYALLFRLYADYLLSNLWNPMDRPPAARATGALLPGQVVLNGTFRYDLVLPDHETKRVPNRVDEPITTNKEKVSRDLGDIFEFEVSAKYALPAPIPVGFALTGTYRFGFKLKDSVSGNRGFAYQSLEDETDYTEHVAIIQLAYSTTPLYVAKKFPIPLNAYIEYRNRFAGSNNVLKSEYIGLGVQVLF